MKRRLTVLAASLGALGVMLAAGSTASAAPFSCNVPLDDFNRANATTLGTSWTLQVPKMNIAANAVTNPDATAGLSTFNAVPPTQQACVDVTGGAAGTTYAALVLGFQDTTNNAFLKVQGSGGTFSDAWFYYGNNGSCKITGGCNFAIPPFKTGRIHAALNVATGQISLDVDTNLDNNPELTIVKTFNAPFSFGNAIGIGSFGGSSLDNFATAATPPPPPVPVTPPSPAPNTKLNRATIKPGQRSAKFWFRAIEGTATKFECAFGKKARRLTFRECASPKAYQGLGEGRFTFKVRAVGPGGADQTPIVQKFSI